MKHKSEITERQNDETALSLLRASERCLNNERYVKYLMIFFSFCVCLAAIFNRYLPQMFPDVKNIISVQGKISVYLNLISGVVLICSVALGFYVSRMHAEGCTLRDRYEAYVFDNAPNQSILRPIPETVVEMYAKKTRRQDDEKFKNAIYQPNESPSPATAQFDYINKKVHADYKLYIYVQPFFLTIWIGFCILVMIIAVSFNDKFITTLINILIPSLSAISIIASSWHNCRLQIRQLQNLVNVIDGIQSMPENKKAVYVADKHNMRLLADGLYTYLASPFAIPKFLIKKFEKTYKANAHAAACATADKTDADKTDKADKAVLPEQTPPRKEKAARINSERETVVPEHAEQTAPEKTEAKTKKPTPEKTEKPASLKGKSKAAKAETENGQEKSDEQAPQEKKAKKPAKRQTDETPDQSAPLHFVK